MTNYKPWGHQQYSYGGYTKPFDPLTQKIIHLYQKGSANAYVTLHYASVNTNYQVPTGKKFIILKIEKYLDASNTAALGTGTAADSSTGFIYIIAQNNGEKMEGRLFYYEVAADLFITAFSSATNAWQIDIIGIEVDA